LGLVNNTSDSAKPISTATQAALDLKASVTQVNNLSTTLNNKLSTADSTIGYVTPTQLASKTFDQTPITNAISGKLNIADSITKYITPAQLAGYNFSSGGGSSNSNNSSNLSFLAPLSKLGNDVSISVASGSVNGYLSAADFAKFSSKIDASQKAANNGVATLGNDGKIPSNQIPAVSFQSANVVSSQAAMLGLSNAQVGSIAIRTDNNNNYVLSALPATNLSNWIQLATPTSVTSVNGYAGPSVALTTSDVAEGTNKYYTDARVRAALNASSPLVMDATNGNISMPIASASANGYLKSTDFATFNSKQNTLSAGVDYLAPNGSAASLTSFPTLNQNTTGTAANVSGTVGVANGGTGATTLTGYIKGNGTSALIGSSTIPVADVTGAAPLASPVFTGTPNLPTGTTAVTQTAGDNSTKIATTAFVTASLSAGAPDATSSSTGKIQLAGDLSGTAAAPSIATGAINSSKILDATIATADLADGSVTDAKIAAVAGSKVSGNIAGTAANVTGIVAVANGGTGATTLTGIVKGNGTSAMTTAIAGTDYQAPISLTTTGSGAATLSGNTLNIPSVTNYTLPTASSSALGGVKVGNNLSIDGSGVLNANIAAGNISGTVAVANGGTGASTQQAAINALTGTQASGKFLRSDGTNATLVNIQAADVPTLNQNTTGNAATVTTNANLTGDVTSVGNASTVLKINGTSLAGLSTGILKNTTTTGVPTIAVAGTDYQAPISLTTTGSGAATLSGNTLNIPSVSSTVNAGSISGTVAVANGGTGATTLSSGALLKGNGTNAITTATAGTDYVAPSGTFYIGTTQVTLNRSTASQTLTGTSIDGNAATATLSGNITATTNTTLTSLASLNTVGTITSGTISLTTNISTTGTLKAGTITYPNTAGTNGYYLKTDGTGTASWAAVSSGGVPYTGATGAVNLGAYDLTVQTVNGLTLGNGSGTHNTIVGGSSPNRTFNSVQSNTAIGYNTISSASPGSNNTAVGAWSLVDNNNGTENSVLGSGAMQRNLGGKENTAIGYFAMQNNLTGSGNTALGYKAGFSSDNTTINNATAIGYQAKVAVSNTIQLGADGTNGTTAITNVKTSGTITAGAVTYPKTDGANGQVLTTNGAGTLSWITASSGGIPYTGATGSVNLGGYDLTVNGLKIGTGYVNPAKTYNTIVGRSALNRTSPGQDNTAIGYNAIGQAGITTTGDKNTAVGSWTLINNTGQENSALGVGALQQNQGGIQNTALGSLALYTNSTGSNNTALGYAADVSANNLSNATAIGNGAKVAASNTIQLGNTSVTNVKTSGTLTAGTVTYPITHGTSGQVLTSLGSGTLTWTTASSGGGTHTVGESFGGGIVFYVTSNGQHGLISETQLISPNANSSSNSDIYYYSLAQDMISDSTNHSTNGKLYTDWRLPTKSEFAKLYAKRSFFNTNYQGRLNYYVWTSTYAAPPNETTKMVGYYQGSASDFGFNAGAAGVIAIRSF
jgi:hypothetical protein